MQPLVLDTNIVLDLLVFGDEAAAPLRGALGTGQVRWLATAAMRDEFERVLAYPHIAARLQSQGQLARSVLANFDTCVQQVPAACKASATCSDPDDQMFIDLAIAHAALLLSRDRAVLALRRRLERLGVAVTRRWPPHPIPA